MDSVDNYFLFVCHDYIPPKQFVYLNCHSRVGYACELFFYFKIYFICTHFGIEQVTLKG